MIRGVVYCYTSPNGKKYVGQTINEKHRRCIFLNINLKYSSGKGKIDKARKKYGPENFTYEVLEEIFNVDKEELIKSLDKLETEYIIKFDSINNGYNVSQGGKNHSRKFSKEERQHMSDIVKNKLQGKIPEHLKDIHMQALEKCWELNLKPVLQYSLTGEFIKEWSGTPEIMKVYGNGIHISDCCNSKISQSGGYIWRYKESEDFPLKIEVKISKRAINSLRKVIQYDKDKNIITTFQNAKEMLKTIFPGEQISLSRVYKCLENQTDTFRGYILKFEDVKWP